MTTERIRKKKIYLTDQYVVMEDIFRIMGKSEFPGGIKGSFVLVDVNIGKPRLLVDNTDHPHEYHMHTNLPKSKYPKIFLGTDDYLEAESIFYKEVERILNED